MEYDLVGCANANKRSRGMAPGVGADNLLWQWHLKQALLEVGMETNIAQLQHRKQWQPEWDENLDFVRTQGGVLWGVLHDYVESMYAF
jgi:hypothetical protein